MDNLKKLKRRCKVINEMVETLCERKEIPDGNSIFPARTTYLPIDCYNKQCKRYKWCNLSKFDNIE